MADPKSTPAPGTSPDINAAFLADRQNFWSGFTKFTTYAVVAVTLLLIVMRLTLV